MGRYIIKNCEQIHSSDNFCWSRNVFCQDCTDCVMKQIVELCKETCRKRCTNDCLGTKKHCGYGQILKLLNIQEVE